MTSGNIVVVFLQRLGINIADDDFSDRIISVCRPTITSDLKDDDVIKWKHFPRYWSFVRGIHRSPVNSFHKGQWRGALMYSLICAGTNGSVNNRHAGHSRHYGALHDVAVMIDVIVFFCGTKETCQIKECVHDCNGVEAIKLSGPEVIS